MLAGGGGDVDKAWRWFLDRLGSGPLVVLRASGEDGYNRYLRDELAFAGEVISIRFRTRAAAFDPLVLERVGEAAAVFIAGGDQARYFALWQGTPVELALREHLASGKPLGGTSAGLAILGEKAFSAEKDGADSPHLDSATVMEDPFHPRVTFGPDLVGSGWLRRTLTDSHFSERSRQGRLLVFLERVRLDFGWSAARGIGVDERTALLIDASGMGTVVSSDGGTVAVVESKGPSVIARGRRASTAADQPVWILREGDQFDFRSTPPEAGGRSLEREHWALQAGAFVRSRIHPTPAK